LIYCPLFLENNVQAQAFYCVGFKINGLLLDIKISGNTKGFPEYPRKGNPFFWPHPYLNYVEGLDFG
jgi:hypothetical protein